MDPTLDNDYNSKVSTPGGHCAARLVVVHRDAAAQHAQQARLIAHLAARQVETDHLRPNFMSCSRCQELGQITDLASDWFFTLECSQSGASLLVDTTLDMTTTHKLPSQGAAASSGKALLQVSSVSFNTDSPPPAASSMRGLFISTRGKYQESSQSCMSIMNKL